MKRTPPLSSIETYKQGNEYEIGNENYGTSGWCSTLNDLAAKQLDRFVRTVAHTRQQISKHFFDNLKLPAAPCLDILFALHANDAAPLDIESLSEYISSSSSITVRYLNLMVGKGLVKVDDGSARITSDGTRELLNMMSLYREDFNQ